MMIKNLLPLGMVGSISASLVLSSLPTRPAWASTEVARINDRVITLDEFNRRYQDNLKYYQLKVPTKKEVLEDLIKREVGVLEARKLGIEKDPEVRDRLNTVLYHALLEKKLGKEIESIHIQDAEAKAFYSDNPEVRTSHIFVAVKPETTPDEERQAKAKIDEINEKYIKPGKMGFAEIAQRFSEGVAAPMGGDLDYQTKDKLDPLYYDTAVKLKTPGKISSVVRSAFGYHIIKLTGVRTWADTDQAQTKRIVFEKKRTELFEKYMNDLKKTYRVSTKENLLN